MPLAITDDHRALAEVARSFLAGQRDAARATLDAPADALPAAWKETAALGWLGLHVPEEYGGEGAGLPELAVVLFELGRAAAPGPFLPSALAAAVVAEAGTDALRAELLPGLADGSRVGAVGLAGAADGDRVTDRLVPGGALADVVLVAVGEDVLVAEQFERVPPKAALDTGRRPAAVTLAVAGATRLPGAAATARRLARALVAAEAAGVARACLDAAVAYAGQRTQFGRTIGTFQAVKHHAADMLVDAELAVAAAWDAQRAPAGTPEAELAAAVAAARAVPAAVGNAELSIQLHGGIGFTWEHDAHLYLRRAHGLAAFLGGAGDPLADTARLVRAGVRRTPDLDLPAEAQRYREDARAFVATLDGLDPAAVRSRLVEGGYLVPHWPPPWGRSASAAEQLVIEQELRGVDVPSLGITGWNIQTIAQHGTDAQRERWVGPTLRGELTWCQLFSEPGAGSDAAAIATRGVRVEGGWRVSGQKVWTSRAKQSDWGFATVRTEPVESTGSKHRGITMMAVDLRSEGVDVRPLRELTGQAMFNEVFLDDVFVPDECVVGAVGQGWAVARATLGNERVSIGGGGAGALPLRAADLLARAADPLAERDVARLVADELALRLMLLRQAARAVGGGEPGPEGNVSKLFSSEHGQRVAALAMRLAGADAVTGGDQLVTMTYLYSRCLTIAGGTSEIARNQIAERILGLPRDPLVS